MSNKPLPRYRGKQASAKSWEGENKQIPARNIDEKSRIIRKIL